MRDVDVFTKLLALKRPWGVEQVIFDEKDKSVSVFLRHRGNARFRCPKCGCGINATAKSTLLFSRDSRAPGYEVFASRMANSSSNRCGEPGNFRGPGAPRFPNQA